METSLESTPITQPQSRQHQANPAGFVQKRLPWLVAAAFLVLYAVTLSRWVSYEGLMTLARAARWDWQLVYDAPLHFLVTYPLRWVPGAWQLIGFNFFAAVCSVLTL